MRARGVEVRPNVTLRPGSDERPTLGAELSVILVAIVALAAFLAVGGPSWLGNVFVSLIGAL
jgi:hypothetical protein